nr:Rossmann-like and DUF2520 domain-containing protein [uncultured Peptoniphilus sp.]
MKSVGIIGAGKVGVSFGIGLFSEGPLRIGGYYSKTEASAAYGAERTGSKVYKTPEELVCDNDVVLIATPDDAIETIWRQLLQLNIHDKIVCHTAGSLSSSLFFDRTTKDVYAASLHPMLAISSKEEGYKSLDGAFFTLEGDPEAVNCLSEVLEYHNLRYKIISGDKARYHLATSLISNSVIALGKVAVDLMTEIGFEEEEAREALAPLAQKNLTSFLEKGAEKALTGPVERGDASTIERHLDSLKDDEKRRELYVAAAKILVDIAEEKHPDRPYDDVIRLLEGE